MYLVKLHHWLYCLLFKYKVWVFPLDEILLHVFIQKVTPTLVTNADICIITFIHKDNTEKCSSTATCTVQTSLSDRDIHTLTQNSHSRVHAYMRTCCVTHIHSYSAAQREGWRMSQRTTSDRKLHLAKWGGRKNKLPRKNWQEKGMRRRETERMTGEKRRRKGEGEGKGVIDKTEIHGCKKESK